MPFQLFLYPHTRDPWADSHPLTRSVCSNHVPVGLETDLRRHVLVCAIVWRLWLGSDSVAEEVWCESFQSMEVLQMIPKQNGVLQQNERYARACQMAKPPQVFNSIHVYSIAVSREAFLISFILGDAKHSTLLIKDVVCLPSSNFHGRSVGENV